jgi:hypothetical protein
MVKGGEIMFPGLFASLGLRPGGWPAGAGCGGGLPVCRDCGEPVACGAGWGIAGRSGDGCGRGRGAPCAGFPADGFGRVSPFGCGFPGGCGFPFGCGCGCASGCGYRWCECDACNPLGGYGDGPCGGYISYRDRFGYGPGCGW